MYDDEKEYSSAVGTAFPPLEADEIVSRKPEIDQTVRDERGRRRFHGAFTGGFSAGYWNTVGSAEGFTPQIFSSSRVNKADRAVSKGARPEDFMDDEDLGSFGIAPKRIHTKEDFAENFAGLRDTSYSLYDVIKSVLEPSKQSIGMRLFTRMKRHIKMEQKLSRQSSKHKAKESSQLLQVESKGDLHGLGYNGALDPENYLYGEQSKGTLVKAEAVSATLGGGRRLKISGEAFGYGALEEEDDYMMGGSVYGTDDMSQYDFALGGPTKKAKDRWKKRTDGVPYGTLAGNSLQLEGFEKAAQRSSLFAEMRRHYRPPEVPNNWRPKKKRRRRAGMEEPKKSRWGAKVEEPANELASKTPQQQPTLNANLRAVILGEEVIVHRMGIAKKESPGQLVQELPPSTTVSVPQKPLSGFFASRFTRGSSALDDPAISAGLSTFKDLSSTPAFGTGSEQKGEAEIAEESSKPPTRTTYQWHPAKLVCRRFGLQHPFPQFPDIVGIVSVDRSGQKTRNMTSKLQTVQQAAGQANSSSRTLFAGLFGNLDGMATFSPAVTKVERQNLPPLIKSTTVIEKIASEEEEDEEDTEEQQPPRPPVDLFKSIFASDEEEEEEEEDSAKSATASKDEASNGSGIFAGVDFAQLNQNFNPCLKEKPAEPAVAVAEAVASNQLDDDCYGPALPPPIAVRSELNISSVETKSSRRHKDKKSKKGKKSKSKKHHRRRRSSSSDSETSLPVAKRHRKSHSEIDSQILELIKEGRRHN